MSPYPILRTALAGLAGGVTFCVGNAILFGLADPLLFDRGLQSSKLIDVWTTIEPLPLMMTNFGLMAAIFVLLAVGRAFIYRSVAPAWPDGIANHAIRYALLVWFLMYVFMEVFAPLNLLGEPWWLVVVELSLQALILLAEGFVVVAILRPGRIAVGGGTPVDSVTRPSAAR